MNTPDSSVHDLSGWRKAVLWPLGLLVKVWGRTLRFAIDPEERRVFETNHEPVACVLWHNRLFLTPEFYRRYRGKRPIYGLVSASRDGAWLAALYAVMNMRAVRGSSSRLGREAATALVDVLRAGHDLGITPDGPRGPCYDFKAGAMVVTRRTGAPMLLIGAEFGPAWRLPSWDRFYLPLPFSRIKVRCIRVDASDENGVATPEAVAARLREINPD